MPDISIIIPTLNEEKALPATLAALQSVREKGVEIIVVDGGSEDNTILCTEGYVDQLFISSAGRAVQLNHGADVARGNWLLFLHADTILPRDGIQQLLKEISRQSVAWGRFDIKLDGLGFVFRIIERMMNWRSCLTGIVTGDHAMFVASALFKKVGAYPKIELMEDVAISKKLKQHSRPICIKKTVLTSSRRWQEHGVIKTVFLMWQLRWSYFFNKDPNILAEKYRQVRVK